MVMIKHRRGSIVHHIGSAMSPWHAARLPWAHPPAGFFGPLWQLWAIDLML